MNYFFQETAFNLRMVAWAFVLHVKRWNRYRFDVVLWLSSIWLTILAQGIFILSAYEASGGQFFNYSSSDIFVFFGITLVATGIAQVFVHGFTLRLADAVWKGNFDFWLLQPLHFLPRVLLEDIGLVWFFPHICIGYGILAWSLPAPQIYLALAAAIAAAGIEIGLIICVCVPAIKWGRWNPNEGLWEYLERSRSIPVARSKHTLLLILSFGVLQYSLALEVVTGGLSLISMYGLAVIALCAAWFFMTYFVRAYTPSSS